MGSAQNWLAQTKSATKTTKTTTRTPPLTSSGGETTGLPTVAGVDVPSSALPSPSLWSPNGRPVARDPQNLSDFYHHHHPQQQQEQAALLLTSILDTSTGDLQQYTKRTTPALPLSQSPPGYPPWVQNPPPRRPLPPNKVEHGQTKMPTAQAPGGRHQRHRTIFQVFGGAAPDQLAPPPWTMGVASASRSPFANTDDAESNYTMGVTSEEILGPSAATTPTPLQYSSSTPRWSPQQQQQQQQQERIAKNTLQQAAKTKAKAKARVDGDIVRLVGSSQYIESGINTSSHRLADYNNSRYRHEGSPLTPTSPRQLQLLPPTSVSVEPLVVLGEAVDITTAPLPTSLRAKGGEARSSRTPTPGKEIDVIRHLLPDLVNNNRETTTATRPGDELDVRAGDGVGSPPPPTQKMVSPLRARIVAGGSDPDTWAREQEVTVGASSSKADDGATLGGGSNDDCMRGRSAFFAGIVYQQPPQQQHYGRSYSYGGGSMMRGSSFVSERKGGLGTIRGAEASRHVDSTSFGGRPIHGREQQVHQRSLSPPSPSEGEGAAGAGAAGSVVRFGALLSPAHVAYSEVRDRYITSIFIFFTRFFSSGGRVKNKLKLTTLPHT